MFTGKQNQAYLFIHKHNHATFQPLNPTLIQAAAPSNRRSRANDVMIGRAKSLHRFNSLASVLNYSAMSVL